MMGHSSTQLEGRTRELVEEHQLGSLLLGEVLGGRQEVAVFTSAQSGLELPAPILVPLDQEGGEIQRLPGRGYSHIPSAVAQGTLGPAELQRQWTT